MFARPAAIFFLAALAGCSTVEPVVALPSASAEDLQREAEYQQEGSLERIRQQDGRVATVSHRLNVANLDLCADKASLSGMAIHHALQYGPDSRPVAIRHFGLTGRPSVLTVVPGGPADKAGIKPDDVLVSIDGTSFADARDRIAAGKPTYDDTLRARGQLDQALADGSGTLVLEQAGRQRTVTLTPVAGCAYEAQLLPSEDLDAKADGTRVFITSAFVRYTVTDDQLAVVLGHELAHNVMRHRARIKEGATGAVLGNAGTMVDGLLTVEREADYVGLYLMARAGYDYGSALEFWRQYGADYARSRYAVGSNPGSLARATNTASTIAEIRRKQAAGEPLVPTPRD
jgi:hypothetical protein